MLIHVFSLASVLPLFLGAAFTVPMKTIASRWIPYKFCFGKKLLTAAAPRGAGWTNLARLVGSGHSALMRANGMICA